MTNVNGIANPGASINNNHNNADVISPAEFNALSAMGGQVITPVSAAVTSTATTSAAIISSANVVAGLYEVSLYYVTTTAGATNSDTVGVFYTDRDTATTALVNLAASTNTSATIPVIAQGKVLISTAATAAVSYVVSHSTGTNAPSANIRIAMRQLA